MEGRQRYFKLRRSRLLALVIVLPAVASLISVWMLSLNVWVQFSLITAVLFWTLHHLLIDAGLKMRRSCVAFRLEEREGIVLVLRSGSHHSGKVLPYSFISPYMVILGVLQSGDRRRRNLLIMPDAMGADSFRRLRVALRWSARPSGNGLV